MGGEGVKQQVWCVVSQPLRDEGEGGLQALASPDDHVRSRARLVNLAEMRDWLLVEGAAIDHPQARSALERFNGHDRLARVTVVGVVGKARLLRRAAKYGSRSCSAEQFIP